MFTRYQGSAIISSLFLLLIVAILLSLGVWQLSRMQEKQAFLLDLEEKKDQPAKALIDVIDRNEARENVLVNVSGTLLREHVWIVDNRPMEREIGYQVLVVVNTPAGNVLLDYGWVASSGDRNIWPEVTLPQTLNRVRGVIIEPTANPFVNVEMFESKPSDSGQVYRIQGIDIAQQSKQSGIRLSPFVVKILGRDEQFIRHWEPVVMPPEKHLGYAIQWFGLAAAALIIGAIAIGKTRSKHV
ncbi:SURF1 family protein [Alteromonas sediminis]|nr:SURF1 family protein [Alteromonas sediminis]